MTQALNTPEFVDEAKDVSPEEKMMLLQKYGMIEPKLTEEEKALCSNQSDQ
jgi:hypothetical protein